MSVLARPEGMLSHLVTASWCSHKNPEYTGSAAKLVCSATPGLLDHLYACIPTCSAFALDCKPYPAASSQDLNLMSTHKKRKKTFAASRPHIQLGTKVCIQAIASLCIPNCRHIMTQHAPGDQNMKFESALESNCQRGIASCFCSPQPKTQASEGAYVDAFVCSLSQKISKAAPWQKDLHLEVCALETGACSLHKLCLN